MPDDFLSQLEADAAAVESTPQDSELHKVAVLAKKIQDRQSRAALLEGELKQVKQELLQLTDEDLIKNNVTCTFGRGEDDAANQFLSFAEKSGYTPLQKTEVHPQTLKAWVREQTETGNSFPMDLFGAYIGQRATIKR